jgi:hypothetical protein
METYNYQYYVCTSKHSTTVEIHETTACEIWRSHNSENNNVVLGFDTV